MTVYVADASVALKWFVDEEPSDSARQLASTAESLLAPDFLPIELGSVIRKLCLAGTMPEQIGRDLVRALPLSGVQTLPSIPLLPAALDVALQHKRSIYDSLYVALALRENCQLVTADLRLYNALKDSLPETMLWVGDI